MTYKEIAESLISGTRIPIINELRRIPKLDYELYSRILMGELEYRFSLHRNGFYISNETLEWHLGFSRESLVEGFQIIGVMYDSFEGFQAQKSKFKDNFYCSFYDADKQQTGYLRNHQLVDETVREILGDVTVADLYRESLEEEEAYRESMRLRIEAGEFDETADTI